VLTGKPPSVNAWLAQCCLYILLMVIVKICITVLIQLDFWDDVRDFILSPVTNPKVEVVMVMLIIPFFINVSIFTNIMIHCFLDCWRYVQ
jgi:Vaculolar membrane protein.